MSAAPTDNVAPSKDASSAAALPTVVSSSSSSSSSSVQRLRGIDDVALDIADAVAQSRTLTAALNLCDDAAKCALLDRQLERLAKREEHLRDELRQLRTEYKQGSFILSDNACQCVHSFEYVLTSCVASLLARC